MDIYLPGGRDTQQTKAIILIHGGGWVSGDKTDFAIFIDSIKKRLPRYAIFNVNYRLATGTGNFFPTQENDIKSPVGFIYSKRGEFGITDKFVLPGFSSGAHLALLQAYKYTSPNVKAVVDFFGPTDIKNMYDNPVDPLAPFIIQSVAGGTPSTQSALYAICIIITC